MGLVAAASTAWSCGVCATDKKAAVYDYRTEENARRHGHTVIYLDFSDPKGDAAPILRRILAGSGQVDKGSVRVSSTPPAVALAYDPRHTSATGLLAQLNQKLSSYGLRLHPLSL